MFRSKASLLALTFGVVVFTAAPVIDAEAQIRGSGRTSVNHHGGGGGHGARPGRSPGGGGGGASRDNNRNVAGNRNSGNRNNNRVNVGNDVNINVDRDHGRYDHGHDWDDHYHPVARGMAFGAAAAVTSAVVGSMVNTLPPACSPYRTSYYYCDGVYYAPQYQGDTVVYVVVDQPR